MPFTAAKYCPPLLNATSLQDLMATCTDRTEHDTVWEADAIRALEIHVAHAVQCNALCTCYGQGWV